MIGFLAKRRRGKDTACDYFVEQGYTKRAFAEPLKRGVQQWFGFTDEQLFTDKKDCIDPEWGISPREACQVIGSEVVRDLFPTILLSGIGNDFWIKNASIWYNKNYENHKGLVVWADVRFQNEVDYILNNGGKVYKIIRPELDKLENDRVDEHQSEESIDNVKNYSGIIVNDGVLEEFYKKLEQIKK